MIRDIKKHRPKTLAGWLARVTIKRRTVDLPDTEAIHHQRINNMLRECAIRKLGDRYQKHPAYDRKLNPHHPVISGATEAALAVRRIDSI
jgi:hypothetical protein